MAGRRPSSHHAIRSITRDKAIAADLDAVRQALDDWSDGGSLDAVDQTLSALDGSLSAFEARHPDEGSFSRDDRIAWYAKKHQEAVSIAATMRALLSKAEGNQAEMYAGLLSAAAIRPPVPIYGVRMIVRLLALGLGMKELDRVSRARLLRVKEVLVAPTPVTPPAVGAPPESASAVATGTPPAVAPAPIADELWQWSDLPRKLGDYELIDVEQDEQGRPKPDFYWRGTPIPLPPLLNLSEFSPDGSVPGEQDTRKGTYDEIAKVIEAWGKRQSRQLNGLCVTAWAVLMGRHLPRSSDPPEDMILRLVIESPWKAGSFVVPVWLGAT